MNVSCPACSAIYRIDPSRIPAGGARARCSECETLFLIPADTPDEPGVVTAGTAVAAEPEPEPRGGAAAGAGATGGAGAAGGAGAPGGAGSRGAAAAGAGDQPARPGRGRGVRPDTPVFGPQDPKTRAHRLARALVSDIVVYNQDKWEESREAGTLRKEFREEILKSWDEYVQQVGEEMAKSTPYFRAALNDILAGGDRVF